MDNRDFLQNREAETLERYGIASDPAERKRQEAEVRSQLQGSLKQAEQQAPQQQQYLQQIETGKEKVFLVNNKARPIHIPSEELVIDGQLSVGAEGPFKIISKDKFDSSYQLQTYTEKPLSTINPHLRGKTQVEVLDEAEYKKRYREYLKGKTVREAEYAKVGDNVNHMADGSLDEFDASHEVRKINTNIIRAQG